MASHPTSIAEPQQSGGYHNQEVQIRPNAFREANILHSAFFGRPLPSSATANSSTGNTNNATNSSDDESTTRKKQATPPKNERLCIGGHRETIFGLSISPDGKCE